MKACTTVNQLILYTYFSEASFVWKRQHTRIMKNCTTVHPSVFILYSILFRNKFRMKKATAHKDYEGLHNSSSICFYTLYFSKTSLVWKRQHTRIITTYTTDYEGLHNSSSICFFTPYFSVLVSSESDSTPGLWRPTQQFIQLIFYSIFSETSFVWKKR